MDTKLAVGLAALLSGGFSSTITWAVLSRTPPPSGSTVEGSAPVTLLPGGGPEWLHRATGGLSIDDPRISFRQLSALAERMVAEDPVVAAKAAAGIPGHDNREAYLGSMMRTWGEKDGVAAATWAMLNYKGQELTDVLYYIADGWAEADPSRAADWFLEHAEGSVLDDALWEVAESWGRKDPHTAFEWTDGLDEFMKAGVMQGLAEGWGAVDPGGAAEAGMAMGDTDYRDDFLVSVMTQWAGSDPDKASAWAVALVNEELRSRTLSELGEMWSLRAPAAAAEWAATVSDPGARRAAESGIAIGWSEHDPAGAVEWALGSVSDPAELEEMVGDITFNWSNKDPRGAVAWLRNRPKGPGTDLVLKTFSGMLLDDDPAVAVAWAAEMADPAERDRQLRSMLDGLVEQYGESAREAIQTYRIPDALKADYAARVIQP